MNRLLATFLLASCLLVAPAQGKNVNLVTLPSRDSVQLTIYNSEDLTLAKETRFVTLKKGANRLQFSWAGTRIDPTSVELRVLAHQDEIDIVDTVFPGQKSDHLIWNIQSKHEGQVPVEVSYFTSGLTWQMDYVAVTDVDEKNMHFRGYVRVFNNSGEQYEGAEIRLIVGKINLVEKIAELAQRNGIKVENARGLAARRFFDVAEGTARDSKPGHSSRLGRDKQIVKQGISEYFMFSVEGVETINHGWSKRMQAVDANDVEFEIVYRMRSFQYGPRPVRFFRWKNDEEHQMGESPLPNGIVRVFRSNGHEGLSYLGQQSLNYVPRRADIEVNLGPDDLVVYQRRRDATSRSDFHFNKDKYVDGWDEHQSWTDTIRNYRSKPITFELRLQIPGDVEFETQHKTTLFDFRTSETSLRVDALGKREYAYQLTIHQGKNAKQQRIRLR